MIGSMRIALALLLASSTDAAACSCGRPDPKAIVARSTLVFDGTVLDQTIATDPAGRRAAVIHVRVERMIKGARPRSGVVTLHSHPSPAMCGVSYPPNFTGRFGATAVDGVLQTDNCTHFGLNLDRFRRPR